MCRSSTTDQRDFKSHDTTAVVLLTLHFQLHFLLIEVTCKTVGGARMGLGPHAPKRRPDQNFWGLILLWNYHGGGSMWKSSRGLVPVVYIFNTGKHNMSIVKSSFIFWEWLSRAGWPTTPHPQLQHRTCSDYHRVVTSGDDWRKIKRGIGLVQSANLVMLIAQFSLTASLIRYAAAT